MPIFPLSQPLSDRELLKTTCHLYKISLLRVLPFSLLCVAILHYFNYGKAYLPLAWQPYHQQSAMFALIVLLPLLGAMITTIDNLATNKPCTPSVVLKETAIRFLSLLGGLVSIALIPMIVLGVCFAAYYGLIIYDANFNVLFAWLFFTLFLVFTTIVSNIYVPWLIFSDDLDANAAQDTSSFLVKGYFLRTFSHSLFAILLIIFLMKLPGLFSYYFASLNIPALAIELGSLALLMLIGPWSLVFLLTNKYDLQVRKQGVNRDPESKARHQKISSRIPEKKNNVSF
ncbi:MAG: hypothetical protein AB7I18_08975 [Candidatus Berkiella sp.]